MRPNWFCAIPCPAGRWFNARVASRAVPPRVRVFAEADLHITVAFLGAVSESQARAAFALAGAWPDGPIKAMLGHVVPMGNPKRFSALSTLFADGNHQLTRGIECTRNRMREAAGLEAETRPVKPHMTVARPQRRASEADRAAALDWARALDVTDVRVHLDELALYTWSGDQTRTLFQIVARQPLGAA